MAILSVTVQDKTSTSPQKTTPPRRRTRSVAAGYQANSSCSNLPRASQHRPLPAPLSDMLPGMHGEFAEKTTLALDCFPLSHSPQTPSSSRRRIELDYFPLSPMPETPCCSQAPSPVAPQTPVTRTVYASAKALPGVIQMHKLPLREFQESDLEPLFLGSNSSTPMPTFRRRSSSLASLSGSAEAMTRPSSLSRPGTSHTERPFSRREASERKQEAVDWFRSSQAINQETAWQQGSQDLLATGRDRRAARKVEKVEDVEIESVNEDDVAPAPPPIEETPPPRRRSCLDPMVLWGAKPKPKEEPRKPVVVARARAHSVSGEGVSVGQGDSLLSRLRRRTIE